MITTKADSYKLRNDLRRKKRREVHEKLHDESVIFKDENRGSTMNGNGGNDSIKNGNSNHISRERLEKHLYQIFGRETILVKNQAELPRVL